MLAVSSVTKDYPTPRGPLRILDGVDLTLHAGEAAAITGPSGSGKSTLLYILGALEAPSTGSVTLDGQNPFALGPRDIARFRNRQIGFVFQDHCLLPQLSVVENVLVPTLVGDLRGTRHEVVDLARTLVEQVGLGDRIDHRPSALSGGERQRVAIARALIARPRLVLCDEPTGNLDAATAASITSLLIDLHRQHDTVLVVVTHSPALAAAMPCQFGLDGGRLTKVRG